MWCFSKGTEAELAPHLKSAISVTCPRLSTRWDLGGRLHHEGLLPSAGDLHDEQQCHHLHPLLQPGAGNQRPQRLHPTEHMPVSPGWEDGRPWVLRPHQISPLTLKAKLQFKSETAPLFSHSLLKYTDILSEVKFNCTSVWNQCHSFKILSYKSSTYSKSTHSAYALSVKYY